MTERTLFETLKTFALLLVAAFTFVPIYFMVVISFKDPVQFATQPFVPTWPIHLANYAIAWEYVGPYIGRTLFVVVTATFLTTLLGSLCAFYFAQFQFFGKEASFYYIIVLMMIPGILNLIPMYVLVTQIDGVLRAMSSQINGALGLKELGWGLNLRLLNSYWALILPATAGGQIMMIFVLRQFSKTSPRPCLKRPAWMGPPGSSFICMWPCHWPSHHRHHGHYECGGVVE